MGAAASSAECVMNLLNINDKPGVYPSSYYASNIMPITDCEPATGQISCDVCVIGGGFTGLSAALHLAERGYKVHLLEAQRIGFGASGRNGGQVGQGQRLDQDALEKMVGKARAMDLWKVGAAASDLVRNLAKCDLVHADFHPGLLYTDHRERYVQGSRAYVAKMNDTYGYDQISFLDKDQVYDLVKSPCYYSGTYDTGGGHIDPLQLALGLARMAQRAGAILHERSLVTEIKEGAIAAVHTATARICAKYVVMGCNGYVGRLHADVSRHVMPINNYIAATEPLSDDMRSRVMTKNIAVADSKFVVNYFRFSDDNRMLFGGTESYGYKFPKDIAAQVRKPMSEIFPQLAGTKIEYSWGGTLGITMNRMPHYGIYGANNILSLSGFSGSGVAMGTLSGQIAAEMIAGQSERFDIMSNVPTLKFPGGRVMRQPLLILAMLWYSLRDKL